MDETETLKAQLRSTEKQVEDLRRLLARATGQTSREQESERPGLKQQPGNLERPVYDRNSEIADLQEELERSSREIKRLQRELSNSETTESSRDVERLTRWVEELDAGISHVLNSRRWRLGYRLARPLRKLLGKPAEPAVPPAVQKVRREFGAWRRREDKKPGSEPEETAPAPSPAPPLEAAARNNAPAPRFSGAASLGNDSSEHILEALRNSPSPVTVLVPIHNAYEELKRCLEALVRNTTAEAELLLVDDASTDGRVSSLLAEYATAENIRVLSNGENLGFVRTVNRGFSESRGDVALLNSDTEVTPRWLENLRLAAYRNPRTATVTPISDNAGAFSVPEIGQKNETPERLSQDEVGRLVTRCSARMYPQTPTGNGFCMYIKREALDDVGHFDAENFPRGYGEENDFCMRAQKRGWSHVVDDATYVFHERQASFGETKDEMVRAGRAALESLHPEYTQLARAFISSEDMKRVAENVRSTFEDARRLDVRPRLLFVHHQARGGTTFTNEDLMNALADRYSPYVLISNVSQLKLFRREEGNLVLLEQWNLRSKVEVTEYSRPDYRAAIFDLLDRYRFELVHIRHLIGQTFDLPRITATLGIPTILSFHDFYYSCPTVHLIDDHGKHCGGLCTPGHGQCTLPTPRLQQFPRLKHAYLGTWREQVERMFEHVDAFVTTSHATKKIYEKSLPVLKDRPFRIIEHGRDLEQAYCASPPGDGPIKILLPGNINRHKGAGFVRELKRIDLEDRLEFHFLGRVADEWRDLGIDHGTYDREEFNERVRTVAPAFMGIFSISPETYCHTLTEAWAAGVPVLASDIGTLRERVKAHGGGWLLDFEDPEGSYRRILEIASDPREYERELQLADLHGIRSVARMADDYKELYESVLDEHRRFKR